MTDICYSFIFTVCTTFVAK